MRRAGHQRQGFGIGCGKVIAAAAMVLPVCLCSCTGQPIATAPAGSSDAAAALAPPGRLSGGDASGLAPAPQPQEPPDGGAQAGTPDQVGTPEQVGTPAVDGAGGASPSRNATPRNVTSYFVLLGDGGNRGVRFGCNDSLVGVVQAATAGADPLAAAFSVLLDEPSARPPGDNPRGGYNSRGAYNSLSASALRFLSGSFDGTTVRVYLAGTLSLGGDCDRPRVEAQLTQTALAAVGAVRAEIYVNGSSLPDIPKTPVPTP